MINLANCVSALYTQQLSTDLAVVTGVRADGAQVQLMQQSSDSDVTSLGQQLRARWPAQQIRCLAYTLPDKQTNSLSLL